MFSCYLARPNVKDLSTEINFDREMCMRVVCESCSVFGFTLPFCSGEKLKGGEGRGICQVAIGLLCRCCVMNAVLSRRT